ncbi:MAG: alkene reductase [Planctomycetota bacterium]
MAHSFPTLFSPVTIGDLSLAHRVTIAPLTRSRSAQPGDVPQDMNVTYYRQRGNPETGASLIVSEATQVSPQGKGYAFTPGIHSDEQVAGWKKVTDAVHAEGGKIFLQLWHVGRISHVDLQPDGQKPVSSTDKRAEHSKTYVSKDSGMVPVSEPRRLETSEIPGLIAEFKAGAQRSKDAGFDGVEVHGANGYIIDQFTRDGVNDREDAYGGTADNRTRLGFEIAQAACEVFGAGRVGYRISPTGTFSDMSDSDPMNTFTTLASRLGSLGLAYLHVVEEFGGVERDAKTEDLFASIKDAFKTTGGDAYIGNGGYTAELGEERIKAGKCDAVAYGKLFISNPDLKARMAQDGPYNEWDDSSFYGGTEKGYIDYPTLSEV